VVVPLYLAEIYSPFAVETRLARQVYRFGTAGARSELAEQSCPRCAAIVEMMTQAIAHPVSRAAR
jgi:hypothetical protein